MRRLILLLASLNLAVPGIALAEDASLCSSLCTSARKECRTKVPLAVDLDNTLKIDNGTKNPMARAVAQGVPASPDTRVRERSEYESRRAERNGMCDDTYARCTRGCANPAAGATPSEVLTRQGQARAGKQ